MDRNMRLMLVILPGPLVAWSMSSASSTPLPRPPAAPPPRPDWDVFSSGPSGPSELPYRGGMNLLMAPKLCSGLSAQTYLPSFLSYSIHPGQLQHKKRTSPFPFLDRKWSRNLSHIQPTPEPPGVSLRLRPREWGHCWLLF